MTATTGHPDLGLIAFRVDDVSDHPGGGHCISLSQTEAEATRELVEQYLTGLSHLAGKAAEAPDGGWALTRPLLFHAHHTAELAAKSALLSAGAIFGERHGLTELWQSIVKAGLNKAVAAVDADWCQAFAALIADLAGNSIGARYARPNKDHTPIDDVWCCVNPQGLATATETFAIQCLAMAQEAEEAGATEA